MADETQEQSFVDSMAEADPISLDEENVVGTVTPADQGKGPDSGAPPAAAGPDPAMQSRLDKLEERLFQSEQQAAYWRGQASRDRQQEVKPPEAPKPRYDAAAFKAEYEANPTFETIEKMARAIAADTADSRAREVESNFDGKLTGTQRQTELRQALEREAQEVSRDYSDYIGVREGKPINEAFDRECFDYAQDLATRQGNPVIQSGPNAGARALSPGMMRAAADAVYGRWARQGKIQQRQEAPAQPETRALRSIIDAVPRSDNLGTRGAGAQRANNGIPKTIEELAATDHFGAGDPQKHIKAARNLCRQMGWNEEAYVKNIIAARRNGEFDS